MARTIPHLFTKHSPRAHGKSSTRKTPSPLRSTFKRGRSPDNFGHNRQKPAARTTRVRDSPYKRPFLAPKTKLTPVREESPQDEDGDSTFDSNFFNDLNAGASSGDDSSSEIDTDFEDWDDEDTLVARLQDNFLELPEKERLASLADALEEPMQARGELLKKYLAHTIAPAAKKVKTTHGIIEERVNNVFSIGAIMFDNTCKKIDQMSLRDEDDLKTAFLECQKNISGLFHQLQKALPKRKQLWEDLRDTIDQNSERSMASLSTLTTELDDVVSKAEKRTKESSRHSGLDEKAKQKLLREFLADL